MTAVAGSTAGTDGTSTSPRPMPVRVELVRREPEDAEPVRPETVEPGAAPDGCCAPARRAGRRRGIGAEPGGAGCPSTSATSRLPIARR